MARLLAERVPPERLLVERDEVDRLVVDREPVEREADARDPDARDAVERLVVREPLRLVPELERELLFVARELEVLAFVTAWRSLSKSLSACLLVLEASRRSARSAAVTSL